jgi:hypothetical protein
MRRFVVAGLLVALVLAGVVSGFASAAPDGLEKVAQEEGFAGTAERHALADSPVADYTVDGTGDGRLSTGLAGVAGVLATFAVGTGVLRLARRRPSRRA